MEISDQGLESAGECWMEDCDQILELGNRKMGGSLTGKTKPGWHKKAMIIFYTPPELLLTENQHGNNTGENLLKKQ